MTANAIATAVTGGQGITDQGQLAAIATATSLLGGAAAGLLGQNALAGMTAAQNETLNNTCANGHHCGEDPPPNEHTYTHQILPQSGGAIDEEQAGESLVVGKGTPPAGTLSNTGDVNLASPDRTNHILNGDATGGGHLWPGAPGKSAFPQSWSPSQIMNDVSDIATDPAIPETVQSNGRIVKDGTRDGINIRVVIEPASKGGGIVTAFPTNVQRNPK
ncbi:EndoU domain-containing protein [Burkholderia vietnamiensis]|uniref:EndoU domain-containing protein n=1 Tax=Burkholderia vietnamiensis TaxID=60552 RepID=A0AAW7T8Z2_BURVI|nr:EndoU domain-containing protein [Burkholderia vietnamiensis]MDN7799811.1 EndoU domain-containing protein [Burkholderia vietnamiensis]MDN8036263.1 EndoU domain-containing protein [Burkholderia vietnamiensis]